MKRKPPNGAPLIGGLLLQPLASNVFQFLDDLPEMFFR